MAEQPLDQSLKKIKILYRVAGMNIEDRKKTWKERMIYTFHFIWIGTDIVLAVNWAIEGASKGLNFVELTHVMPCLALGIMAEFKTSFYTIYEDKVHALINCLRDLEERKLLGNPLGEKIVKVETKYLGVLINVLVIANVALLVMFNLGPLILIAVKYYMTGELVLILPFLDVYPFDGYDLRYWPFAYLHEIWTACIVLTEIFAIDFLFYICCTHIKIQFKLLQREVEDLIPHRGVAPNTPGAIIDASADGLEERFRELVKWHQTVISSASILEEIYSKSTLYNYITSSMVICLTGFNVSVIRDVTIVATFAIVLVVGMMQIFFLCFFGDMLMNSSTDVSNAAYNCRWYMADITFGKKIIMMLTRAQKPCKLTAAGFADVNLKAFMKILSTAWSYFALLQTVYRSA